MIFVSAVFSLIAMFLLLNVDNYMTDRPALAIFKNHHLKEVVLSFLAFLILSISGFILLRDPVKKINPAIFFSAAILEFFVILILLFPNSYYKLCNNNCVMHGSQAGLNFDQPCADNISFMTLHYTSGLDVKDYKKFYKATPFPLFYEYSSPIAMHEPIFPGVHKTATTIQSDQITFTLTDDKNLIDACTLYIRSKQFTESELKISNVSFKPIDATHNWTARWKRNGDFFDKTLPTGPSPDSPPKIIAHKHTVSGTVDRITYITYKFIVTYLPYKNGTDSVHTPRESIEVNFVLQDFHEKFSMYPAPVYVQGNMKDVLDVLFIPAIGDRGGEVIDQQFLADFRKSCRSIIKDAIFQEPSLKFWRKQFNFWINNQGGQAMDARCDNCCHTPPSNFTEPLSQYVSKEIEFKALLHKGTQWDFTDHCTSFFSAEMELVNQNDEQSSFLHELGHAAYGLCDEYHGGHNEEAIDHLPNTWRRRSGAKRDAPFRHKTVDDVKKIF